MKNIYLFVYIKKETIRNNLKLIIMHLTKTVPYTFRSISTFPTHFEPFGSILYRCPNVWDKGEYGSGKLSGLRPCRSELSSHTMCCILIAVSFVPLVLS